MIVEITSKTNNIYKHVKSLYLKNYREKNGQFVIEGVRIIKDALQSCVDINMIVISAGFLDSEEGMQILNKVVNLDIKVYKFSDALFKEVADTKNPQGILAVLPIKKHSIKEVIENIKTSPFHIFCDEVQDPGNMGTIIRTADAAGANTVILSKGCVDVYNPKTVRSTMGSLFRIPIIKIEDTLETLDLLKKLGINIISGDLSASLYHFDIDMKKAIAIVIGNEANGIGYAAKDLSDHFVKIPLMGQAESLNVAIAAGILMYEVVRQRV